MNYLYRIVVFFGLIMAFAFAASANASEQAPQAKISVKTIDMGSAALEQHARSGQLIAQTRNQQINHAPWIANVVLEFNGDQDGDGYHHHFKLRFDANTPETQQDIYANIYLYDGQRDLLLHTTDTFSIYSDATTDAKEISANLTSGYTTQTYDIFIDLHSARDNRLLMRVGPNAHSTLANAYLEGEDLDLTAQHRAYLHQYTIVLRNDYDQDGYYSSIDVEADIDTRSSSERVSFGVEINDPQLGWKPLYQSAPFYVNSNNRSDRKKITIDLDDGYAPARYPLRISLYEDNSSVEFSTESITEDVLLESYDYDQGYDSQVTQISTTTTSSGGSAGIAALLALTSIAVMRRRQQIRKPL